MLLLLGLAQISCLVNMILKELTIKFHSFLFKFN